MTLVDRFVCRREGHVPAMQITSSNPPIESYITSCRRCGKLIEIDNRAPAEDGESNRSEKATSDSS